MAETRCCISRGCLNHCERCHIPSGCKDIASANAEGSQSWVCSIFLGSVRSGELEARIDESISGWFCSSCAYIFRAWRRRVVCRFQFLFCCCKNLIVGAIGKEAQLCLLFLVLFDFFSSPCCILKSGCWSMGLRSSSFFFNIVSFLCNLSWCSRFSLIKFVAAKLVKLWFDSSFVFRAGR